MFWCMPGALGWTALAARFGSEPSHDLLLGLYSMLFAQEDEAGTEAPDYLHCTVATPTQISRLTT